jgi:Anti-sigma-K factor rskA, C-terminal
MSDEGRERGSLEPAADELDVELAEVLLVAEPVDPPPEARARLRARIAAETRPLPRSARRPWLAPALAAGLAALLASAGTAWLLERPPDSLAPAPAEAGGGAAWAEERAALEAERDELQQSLEEQDGELAGLEESLASAREKLALLRLPGVEWVELAGTAEQPEAAARVAWEWDEYGCYLHATGLAPLPDGRTYALWLYLPSGSVLRAGTFRPEAAGEAELFAKLPRDMDHHVLRTVVTVEPEDASDAPSGPVQLSSAREKS